MMTSRLTAAFLFCLVLTALSIVPATAEEIGFGVIKAEFELTDRDGVSRTYAEFRDKNVLLTFGFTHCPHICPMIAAKMAAALKITEKDSVGIFISVDTERDTPAITDNYAKNFGPTMIGLGGSYTQVAAAAKNFNATFVVTKSEDTYTVQHTPGIFLLSPDGELIDVFPMNTAADKIAQAMR